MIWQQDYLDTLSRRLPLSHNILSWYDTAVAALKTPAQQRLFCRAVNYAKEHNKSSRKRPGFTSSFNLFSIIVANYYGQRVLIALTSFTWGPGTYSVVKLGFPIDDYGDYYEINFANPVAVKICRNTASFDNDQVNLEPWPTIEHDFEYYGLLFRNNTMPKGYAALPWWEKLSHWAKNDIMSTAKHYLVLPWQAGLPINRLPLSNLPQTVALCLALIRALQSIHAKNFVHRDIQPSNFLITPDPHNPYKFSAAIIDCDQAMLNGTWTQTIRGNIPSFDPTMIQQKNAVGRYQVTFALDIFSLGVLFAELLLGNDSVTSARRAQAETNIDALSKSHFKDLKPLNVSVLKDNYQDTNYSSISEIVVQMMDSDASKRPQLNRVEYIFTQWQQENKGAMPPINAISYINPMRELDSVKIFKQPR